MYGPLVVHAAGGAKRVYTGGPAFDREETILLAEIGVEGHEAARRAALDGADPYNWLQYRPDYFLLGDRFVGDARNVSRSISARRGERILLRLINAGYVTHAVHSHSGAGQVVATDGRPWPGGPTTDTVWIGPGEKYDVLFVGGTAGRIDIHDHVDVPYPGGGPDDRPGSRRTAPSGGQIRSVALYVREGWSTLPDGARVFGYGFTDDPTSAAKLPGPTITVNEGDVVEFTVVNDDGPGVDGHSIEVPGLGPPLESAGPVPRGQVGKLAFIASTAGSYLYGDGSAEHRRMGMTGALIVRPAGGARVAFAGGPSFDRDYTMVLTELDAGFHEATRQAIQEKRSPTARGYVPNYFLINGLAYPDTERDMATTVHVDPGARVLIRMLNAGKVPHAMHLHGYHFDLVARNGVPWPNGPRKDTVLIGPGETYDLLFLADQAGLFPLHDHFETANTNNGVWLGGMHTMVATGMAHQMLSAPSAAAPNDGRTVAIRDNYFTPNRLTVPVGSTVRWDHQGRVEHTVTSLVGIFDSGALSGGEPFSFTFTAPGRYDYFCRFHITNRGTIVVE
jgi:FtsP/CotA-like multicopper oxidase with cupredoxin domain